MSSSVASKLAAGKLHKKPSDAVTSSSYHSPSTSLHSAILNLQGSAGNRAVNTLVHSLGGGAPLPMEMRGEMEQRFGEDFSNVRVHTDAHAAQSATKLNAEAYAVGNDIVFNGGRFTPETTKGKRVLAHELAHVVQQRRGGGSAPIPYPKATVESAADDAAGAAVETAGPIQVSGASQPGIARQPRAAVESFEPGSMSNAELVNEIMLIATWLQKNNASSMEAERVSSVLEALLLEAMERGIKAKERQELGEIFTWLSVVPGGGKQIIQAANLATGLEFGFLKGLYLSKSIEPDALEVLKTEFSDPLNSSLFSAGAVAGVHLGVLKDLKDTIVGLAKLAYFAAIDVHIQNIKRAWEFIQDPQGVIERDLKTFQGLKEFIQHLETDPAFLFEQGSKLGVALGAEAQTWFTHDFMQQTPFEKGLTIGTVLGYAIGEAIQFLLPPTFALKVARGASGVVRGSRLFKVVLEILEHAPGIKKIVEAQKAYEARRLAEAAESVVSSAQKVVPEAKAVEAAAGGVAREANVAERTIPQAQAGGDFTSKSVISESGPVSSTSSSQPASVSASQAEVPQISSPSAAPTKADSPASAPLAGLQSTKGKPSGASEISIAEKPDVKPMVQDESVVGSQKRFDSTTPYEPGGTVPEDLQRRLGDLGKERLPKTDRDEIQRIRNLASTDPAAARDALDALETAVEKRRRLAQQPEHLYSESEEGVQGRRTVQYEPSPKRVPIQFDATTPLPSDRTGQRLLDHVEEAVRQFEAEAALTDKQLETLRALEVNGRRGPYAANRGDRIDELTKLRVMNDPELTHVDVIVRGERGPDFIDKSTGIWYDMTTPDAWNAHVVRDAPQFGPRGFRLPTEPSWRRP